MARLPGNGGPRRHAVSVLGHSHALSGLAAGAATLPWAPVGGTVGQVAWIAAVGGMAMLPDLDHNGPPVSGLWGPPTGLPSGAVWRPAPGQPSGPPHPVPWPLSTRVLPPAHARRRPGAPGLRGPRAGRGEGAVVEPAAPGAGDRAGAAGAALWHPRAGGKHRRRQPGALVGRRLAAAGALPRPRLAALGGRARGADPHRRGRRHHAGGAGSAAVAAAPLPAVAHAAAHRDGPGEGRAGTGVRARDAVVRLPQHRRPRRGRPTAARPAQLGLRVAPLHGPAGPIQRLTVSLRTVRRTGSFSEWRGARESLLSG